MLVLLLIAVSVNSASAMFAANNIILGREVGLCSVILGVNLMLLIFLAFRVVSLA